MQEALSESDKANDIKLEYKINSNIVTKRIITDKSKVMQVVSNLINNAIKYSPQGETIIVRLYKKNTKHKVCLEIENTGITIDKQYLNQIFEPFFRIEKSRSRKTGGSGLGLYIVSQIFKSHGFEHSIKSKDNSVVFIVELKS